MSTTPEDARARRAADHHGSAEAALQYWMHIGRRSGGDWREDEGFELALRNLVSAEAQAERVAA
jgi:hypothetical protein